MLDAGRLALLDEVRRRGSLAAAAAAAGYSPSAVSQQLALLSREVGVPLLERVGRGVRLTPDGERLAGHAPAIIAALDLAESDARAGVAEVRGPVAVAGFATAVSNLVIPAALLARERYPDLRVDVAVLEPPAALEAARRADADVALVYDYSLVPMHHDPALRYSPVRTEEVLLATAASRPVSAAPVSLAGFAAERWIVGAEETADHDLVVRACAAAGYEPLLGHRCDDFHVIARLVAADLGVALVPRDAHPWTTSGVVLTPVAAPLLTRGTLLVTRPAAAARTAVRTLSTLLRECARAAGG